LKRILETSLAAGRLDEIERLAEERSGVLGALVPFTYQLDPLLAWRAIEAMGRAAARVAERSPGAVREHLRRLMWLITEESGGLCWRAPEAMAEIVSRRPAEFADYVPIIVTLLTEMAEEDLAHFRAGILWAIGRLGPLAEAAVEDVLPQVTAALEHPDPQVRGLAAWALARCGRAELALASPALTLDQGPVELYENGALTRTSVAALIARTSLPTSAKPA